jgi:hypothetical protein
MEVMTLSPMDRRLSVAGFVGDYARIGSIPKRNGTVLNH